LRAKEIVLSARRSQQAVKLKKQMVLNRDKIVAEKRKGDSNDLW
jgi:hypothetical protein